jgi:homogentisate 1,2-dioxygenase
MGNMVIEEGDDALQPRMSRFRVEQMADAAIELRASNILMAGCTTSAGCATIAFISLRSSSTSRR